MPASNKIEIEENADMKNYTSFKAGGRAAVLIKVSSADALKEVLKALAKKEIPHLFLGNGSNILFRDEGYAGAVIKMQDFADVAVNEDRVVCQTGIYMSSLAKILMNEGLAGFEFASGIPGTLGGGLFMNAGAYGGWEPVLNGEDIYFYTDAEGKFYLTGGQKAVFEDVDTGAKIRITEADAEGYATTVRLDEDSERDSKEITFTVTGDTSHEVVYVNRIVEEDIEMPETGGTGTMIFAGFSALSAALAAICLYRRRREKAGNNIH